MRLQELVEDDAVKESSQSHAEQDARGDERAKVAGRCVTHLEVSLSFRLLKTSQAEMEPSTRKGATVMPMLRTSYDRKSAGAVRSRAGFGKWGNRSHRSRRTSLPLRNTTFSIAPSKSG